MRGPSYREILRDDSEAGRPFLDGQDEDGQEAGSALFTSSPPRRLDQHRWRFSESRSTRGHVPGRDVEVVMSARCE
jgi:hypothetical protein